MKSLSAISWLVHPWAARLTITDSVSVSASQPVFGRSILDGRRRTPRRRSRPRTRATSQPAPARAAIDITPAAGTLIAATIEAARGNTAPARDIVLAALAADPEHSRVITARARHALGLCALADDDYPTAFEQLRQLFGPDGTPCHRHVSYLAAGDLALAAARADRGPDGREIIKQIAELQATATRWPSPRLRRLLARADCLLADPATPHAYPDDLLSDPAGEQWPFERAQLSLEYGQWLRRQRRINQAKQALGAAHDTFRALESRPWADRAATELRACGIAVPGAVTGAAGLGALTPQQRRIIELAAQGLSNREIAQRLILSPRTIASHLHRSFPVLGVAGRRQLHALVSTAGLPADTGCALRVRS
jgi:DNA-binding CsgD family transcriptional regulator